MGVNLTCFETGIFDLMALDLVEVTKSPGSRDVVSDRLNGRVDEP